ncbi:MAG: DNA-binding transcriptional ArsR family regulator [Moritella sp.]|jgi:DNA-binding transcriptional ArsR family regulator
MTAESCKFAMAEGDELLTLNQRAEDVSSLLKTLAHAERLKALCMLAQGELPVATLQAMSALSQSALSQHLAILRKADIIEMRKEAQCVFYRIKDTRIFALLAALETCI